MKAVLMGGPADGTELQLADARHVPVQLGACDSLYVVRRTSPGEDRAATDRLGRVLYDYRGEQRTGG